MEDRYANFSDLHSRPASVYTTKSFYSLGFGGGGATGDDSSSFGHSPPPVPPIPAAHAHAHAHAHTRNSPQMREREKVSHRYSPSMSTVGDGPLLPYARSEGRFMGRLAEAQGGGYRLEYFDDGKPPGSPLRFDHLNQNPDQNQDQDRSLNQYHTHSQEQGSGNGISRESDESSAYGGVRYRHSLSTLDGQKWIDEYTQRRETFRRSEGEASVMIRPLSHREV